MNQNTRSFFLYRVLSLSAAAVTVVLRTLNLLFFYEKDIGYYAQGSLLPTITEALIFLSVAFFAVFSLVSLPKDQPFFSIRTKSTAVAPYVTAIALIVFTVGVFSLSSLGVGSVFDMPLFVAGTLGAVYFLLFALDKGSPWLYFICGVGAIAWLALLLIDSYFDIAVQMNAPTKLALQLGCIGGMLLMFSELRRICGYPAPRFAAFSTSCACLFLGMASIPSLVADALSRLPARRHTLSDFVFFGLFLLALARLTVPAAKETDSPADPEISQDIDRTPTDDVPQE